LEEGVVWLRRQARGRQIGADAGDGVETLDAAEEPHVVSMFGAANDVPPDWRLRARGSR